MFRDANQLINAENILVLAISPIVDVGISCRWITIGFCSCSIYTSAQKVKRYTFGVRQYLEDFKKAEGNYIDWIEARVEDIKKLEAASKRKPDLMICRSDIVFLSFVMRIKVLVYG
jgi:hypothetical protein